RRESMMRTYLHRAVWFVALTGAALVLAGASAGTALSSARGHTVSSKVAASQVLHVVQQQDVLSLDPNVQAVRAEVRIGEEILETPTRFVSAGSGSYKLVPWLT